MKKVVTIAYEEANTGSYLALHRVAIYIIAQNTMSSWITR